MVADTPRGLQPFQPGPNTFTTSGKPHPSTDRAKSATPSSKTDLNLELRRNIYDDKGKEIKPSEESEKQTNGDGATANGPSADATTKAMDDAAREPLKTFNCFSCGIDCTRSRFHYAKSDPVSANTTAGDAKYDLCPNCYFQSRMPSNHRSSDFVKMEEPEYSSIPDKDAPWSDSETLLLLEALELFDTDWNDIQKHVGTRTREECVLKFLKLEIQDRYLEDGPNHGAALKALSGRSPISQLDNPVMSVITFLSQLADPGVVAAASGRSIAAMQKELRAQLEQGDASEATKPKEALKAEDAMDVDETQSSEANAAGSSAVVNDIATTAIATVAARSSGLASYEERELTRLVGAAVNLTLQKFELKLAQFAEMEEIVQAERRDLEKGRQQLFLDRLAFKKRMKDMENTFKQASLKAPEEGMRMMQEAVHAQQGSRVGFANVNGGTTNGVGPVGHDGGDSKGIDL